MTTPTLHLRTTLAQPDGAAVDATGTPAPASPSDVMAFIHERMARRLSLACLSLAHMNLEGLFVPGMDLALVNFYGSKLAQSNFTGAYAGGADVRACDLTNTVWDHANVCGADFTGSTITGASFNGTEYDASTRWPHGCAPAGAVQVTY